MKAIYKGTFDFEDLRKQGCIYVDKTAYFHRMITRLNDRFLLFSRPRRFGKSMMISALKHIFLGHRSLFDGLYIAGQTDYDWKTYPVLHLDMSNVTTGTAELFRASLMDRTERALKEAGLKEVPKAVSAADMLAAGIEDLYRPERPVVVLVDEYDAPIGETLHDSALAEEIRTDLSDFYKRLKAEGPRLRFMLMTGVAKFTKFSVFSSLNSPTDITFEPEYAAMLGYTDAELDANFGEIIAVRAGLSPCSDYRGEIRRWFNGYRFTKADVKVYNPVSIAQTLTSSDYRVVAQWTGTGRPAMLSAFLKTHDVTALSFEAGISASMSSLESSSNLKNLKPKAILFQTGYLTITEAGPDSDRITLGFPDEEVRRDMYQFLTDIRAKDDGWCRQVLDNLDAGEIDEFLTALPALYAGLPSNPKDGRLPESHYRSVLLTLMKAGGYVTSCEQVHSSGKRSDLVVETEDFCYIFELKCSSRMKAATAVRQILDKKCAAPHLGKGKQVIAVGLVFDPVERTLRSVAAKRCGEAASSK